MALPKVQVNARLEPTVYDGLAAVSKGSGLPVSVIIEQSIRMWLALPPGKRWPGKGSK